jgi:Ca2+:H+ antiporter
VRFAGLWLLALIPVALGVHYLLDVAPAWTFVAGIAAIVPLAEWIRRATEQISHRAGSAIGGLLNATFGNTAELVLAIFVLLAGHADVVKAQITGSIIGNGLLGFGLAITVGTWGRRELAFKPERAALLSSLLVLVVIALLVPALFDYTERGVFASADAASLDESLSLCVAVVLIVVYGANLVYTLVTHRDVFAPNEPREAREQAWSMRRAIAVLVAATVGTAWMAELVSGALEATATTIGVSTFFLGVVVLAIIGNVAEYVSSIYFARKGRLGLVATITVGSTIQVALLVAPILVLVSYVAGAPMDLVFGNPLELVAIASVALAVNAITRDGEATWFEGVLLLAVYVLLAFAFFFATPPAR